MKRLIVTTLFASGLLLAAHHDARTDEYGNPKLSWNERIALETASPNANLKGKHDKPVARVQKDKTTVIAIVPYGK